MTFRGVFRGGAMGAKPPPGQVKSIDFRGFSGPNGCYKAPLEREKNVSPPVQIPEYAPE